MSLNFNGLLQQLSTTTPLWDVSRWLLLIVKALVMAILISGYALWRARHCYTMTILTGVFHCIAYAQVVIGIYMLSIGVLFAFAKAPVVRRVVIGRVSYDYLPSSYHVLNHRGRTYCGGIRFGQCL